MTSKITLRIFLFIFCFAVMTSDMNAQALVANAGNAQDICNGSSVSIGGNPTASGGIPGYTYVWSPSSGLSSSTIANPTASPTVTTTYTVTVSDNNGGTATSTVVVTVNATPALTNLPPFPFYCQSATVVYFPTSNVAGATFSWTAMGSSGSVVGYSSSGNGPINETITNTGTSTETVTYIITPTGPPPSSCLGSPSTWVVTLYAATTSADAGNNQTICGTSATLAGNPVLVGYGVWLLISGSGTITTPSSPTSTVTGLGVGPNVFQWTINNVNCGPTSSQVTIIGNPPPTVANAGPNQYVCTTTATLAANIPVVGIGSWSLISGSGNITTPASATSGLTNLGPGNNVFEWTITNPPCAPTSSQVTITVCVNVGVEENILSDAITISPNPFTSQTTITFDREMKNTPIYLRDVLGKEVIGHLSFVNGKSITIDLNDVSNGIYFVQVGNTFRKIIKQ